MNVYAKSYYYSMRRQVIPRGSDYFSLGVAVAISILPGCIAAVVSAHQPVELPRKYLTTPWE